jgi:pyruvate/2-oxoacid:ferredoxin oxidoreductase beta subunit
MAEATKKRNKLFEEFVVEDQFSGGVAWCAGCPLELIARTVPKVMGKNVVLFGTPSCSAPVLHGQNLGAWHHLS